MSQFPMNCLDTLIKQHGFPRLTFTATCYGIIGPHLRRDLPQAKTLFIIYSLKTYTGIFLYYN